MDALAAGLLESLPPASARARSPYLTVGLDSARGPEAETDGAARAPAFAALLCAALQEHLRSDLVLILDDVHEVGANDPSMALIEGLCRQAPSAPAHPAVCAGASPLLRGAYARARERGQISRITALAFDGTETAEVLRRLLGEGSSELAVPMLKITEGWPVAVRLAAEALRTVPVEERLRELERVWRPGGPSSPIWRRRSSPVKRRRSPRSSDDGRAPGTVQRWARRDARRGG